jgi:phage tail sheath protein FI
LFALEKADLFNLLCLPPFSPTADVDKTSWDAAASYAKERRAMVLADPPFITAGWDEMSDVTAVNAVTAVASRSENVALFFPRIQMANPLKENRPEPWAPCGAVAGVMARTDAARGVWKSPAGIDATLAGALDLQVSLTDLENGKINQLGVNCLRSFPTTGPVVWGARTLKGADSLASEWKYLAVRRMALFLEESLYRGTQWVVFEPNDEPLWAQIRLNIGAFLQTLFRQGAFQGRTPREAYFVKCDRETTTQTDINMGVVNILVGFAPLKPAEFVVVKLQQIAGDIPT